MRQDAPTCCDTSAACKQRCTAIAGVSQQLMHVQRRARARKIQAGHATTLRWRGALACPCLDDLKAGPCSERFVESFTCFLKHKHEEPGTYCYPVFEKLHACVNEHRKHFKEVFAS